MKNRSLFIFIIACFSGRAEGFQLPAENSNITYDSMPQVLPGTKQLTWEVNLSDTMMYGAQRFIETKINESVDTRSNLWHRDFSSKEAYELSIEPNRKRFMKYIGVIDKSEPYINYNVGLTDKYPPALMQKFSNYGDSILVAETVKYLVYQVRWPVLNRVYGEGLLIQPKTKPIAIVIAIPDADQTPEQLMGLSPGVPAQSQFARRLAENGFQVLVPVLISRSVLSPENGGDQTYREWIYRQAFHMGRHLIGYEVQKVQSAIDWFKQSNDRDAKIGVAGYCEGGLIAFYSAAVDQRIDVVLVSGYFHSRQQVWDEPIYRNVWGLLTEFGDAEIASMIAPRPLVVEHSLIPGKVEESTAKPLQLDESAYTGYKGQLKSPTYKDVLAEFNRIDKVTKKGYQPKNLISDLGNKPISFGSEKALEKFTLYLGYDKSMPVSKKTPIDNRSGFSPEDRQIRQVKELEDHVQWLLRNSDNERNRFFLYKAMPEFGEEKWSTKSYHQYYSPDQFIERIKDYRKYFREEILGEFDNETLLPPNARTRKVYDEQRWTGYEVVLDVYTNFIAPGVLLIPKDIKSGEKRPVVVAQHGRNGEPKILIEGNTSYNNMAAKLADQGFIVYLPNGLFRGEDKYRWLDRKANTIKKTLFSFIIAQHEQTLQWLGTLPFADPDRIAFYGKSYGGETAIRVPPVLEGYCLSICSADFGDWTRKVVDTHYQNSFMNSIEWEMPYFNMGNTFSYAEMAYLMFPRPFMVERGRHDLVQPDEFVAYEFAKVKHLYDQFNFADRAKIEYFNGGHAARNEGTFDFLHKYLSWP